MPTSSDHKIYEALMMPSEALDKGGLEILRAGLVDDELYVTARRVFTDPATWGEVLADIARRLALLHSAEGEYAEAEVLAAIESAFAADLGAPLVKDAPARKKAGKAARKAPKRAVRAKKSARRPAPKRAKVAKRAKAAKTVKRSKR